MPSIVGGESGSLRKLISKDSFKTIFTSSGNSTKEFSKTFFFTTKEELLFSLLTSFSYSFDL